MESGKIMSRLKLLLLVALTVNYTSILTSLSIWHNAYIVYLLSAVTSLFFGLVVGKIQDLAVLMFSAYVIGSFGSMLAVASPGLLRGASMVVIEVGMFGTTGTLIYNSFIIVPLCMLSGLFGVILSERFVKGSRMPGLAMRQADS